MQTELPDFLVISKSTLHIWRRKLECCCKQRNTKMLDNKWFGVDVVPPVCTFIKIKTLAHVYTCEFWEVFRPATLRKPWLDRRWFLVNFANFYSLQLYQKCHLCFFSKFWEISQLANLLKTRVFLLIFMKRDFFWKHKSHCKFFKIFENMFLRTICEQQLLMYDFKILL